MELSNLIRYSPKRLSLFESLMAQVSPGAPSLKPLCPTQWTVRTKAINAILTNYHLLQETLEVIKEGKDEYALKVVGFLDSMDKFSTYFGLELSYLVFSATVAAFNNIAGNRYIFKASSTGCQACNCLYGETKR